MQVSSKWFGKLREIWDTLLCMDIPPSQLSSKLESENFGLLKSSNLIRTLVNLFLNSWTEHQAVMKIFTPGFHPDLIAMSLSDIARVGSSNNKFIFSDVITCCYHDVTERQTSVGQVRLGKVRLGHVRKPKVKVDK